MINYWEITVKHKILNIPTSSNLYTRLQEQTSKIDEKTGYKPLTVSTDPFDFNTQIFNMKDY